MKKYLIIIVVLSIIASILYFGRQTTTIKQELSDFSVKDTSLITKVFFADKFGNSVYVNKAESEWLVNNKHKARPDAISTLLSTIHDIEVNYPVSNSLHNSVVKKLASKGIKVEIYTKNEIKAFKTYYVGEPAANMIGSFMLLENSSKPFVMYIPGFNGFLAPRYNIDGSTVDEELWKDRVILEFDPNKINSVEIINHENENLSYSIKKDTTEQYFLAYKNKSFIINNEFGKQYFDYFNKISCEGFMNDFSAKDSIVNSPNFHTIKIKSDKKEIEFKTFHKLPKRDEYLDQYGEKLKYDPDRLFALIDSEFVLIQFFIFNKLLLDPTKIPVEK